MRRAPAETSDGQGISEGLPMAKHRHSNPGEPSTAFEPKLALGTESRQERSGNLRNLRFLARCESVVKQGTVYTA